MPEYIVPDVCLRSWHIFEADVRGLLERLEGDVDLLERLEVAVGLLGLQLEEDVARFGTWTLL